MNTFLLAWNPKKWPWPKLEYLVQQVITEGEVRMPWSCGNTRNIVPGDRVYLVRLGPVDHRGIMGNGYVVRSPYLDKHFTGKNKLSNTIDVAFDLLLNPEKDAVLPLELLQFGSLAQQLWTPQTSGISIRAAVIEEFEALWKDHLLHGDVRPELVAKLRG